MHENEENITISLIIPVYNVSKYIERCMKSVIKQTYNHFECILVDDASPDDSIAICERMIAAYDGPIQFRILHHQQNRGLSAARNTGIDAATGDYILFIDSDDIISNDCVEKLMAPVLKDCSIEMVAGEYLRFSDKGLPESHLKSWEHQEDLKTHEAVRDLYFDTERHLQPAVWNRLTSRTFINQHQLRFKEGQIWEDALWTFFEMKYLSHIYIIPDITYYYYHRLDSISNGIKKEIRSKHGRRALDIISSNFTPGDESREAAKFLPWFCNGCFRIPKKVGTMERRAIAHRFAKALPFRKYPKENILLFAVNILPHNKTGKAIYYFIYKRLIG